MELKKFLTTNPEIRNPLFLKNGKVLHNTFLVFNIKKCDFRGVFSE